MGTKSAGKGWAQPPQNDNYDSGYVDIWGERCLKHRTRFVNGHCPKCCDEWKAEWDRWIDHYRQERDE